MSPFMFFLNGGGQLKFIIEVYAIRPDSSVTLLYRSSITVSNPAPARREAARLLARRERSNFVRVLNAQGEILFKIDKSRP